MIGLSDEQRLIQQTAREFTRREVLPLARELDPKRGEIPRQLIAKMGAQGYFGILIPTEYGGLGLGALEYCLVAEELARGWMSVASLLARGNRFYRSIPGSGRARREKIEAMAQGEYLGAYSISEPEAGSDLGNISCRARRDGDHWIITGNKYWCTFADGADFIEVIARTEEAPPGKGHRGLTAIAVEKPRGELPQGVSGTPIPKIGYFGWKTWELHFDDVRAPLDAAGEEGRAFYRLAADFELMRAHTAARAIGLSQGALEDAMSYARERRQFGQAIAEFQAIRFEIAKMSAEIAAARALLHEVCALIDANEPAAMEAARVKYLASEMAERTTSAGLQILGGAGYTTLHDAERHWRDARLTKIFEGSSQIMLRIVSDALLGRE